MSDPDPVVAAARAWADQNESKQDPRELERRLKGIKYLCGVARRLAASGKPIHIRTAHDVLDNINKPFEESDDEF
ncbi:hypothetical protein ACQR1I_14285 [Bradyrhizobium sp. HKCCYLS2038]|uniref:hypothetical protein n=1 Tax=unclassified Bradyrhizobium TaxID=2631580 RepID=UPI003EC07905